MGSRLQGRWRVTRRTGLIPPFGLSKRIGRRSGWTCLFGIPVAPFAVRGRKLHYRLLPIVDELSPRRDGSWNGRGVLLGREFCRFRLEPRR